MKNSKSGNILAKEIKKITERYLYFDFSLEQDIIILPPKIEKPNDITREFIGEGRLLALLYEGMWYSHLIRRGLEPTPGG